MQSTRRTTSAPLPSSAWRRPARPSSSSQSTDRNVQPSLSQGTLFHHANVKTTKKTFKRSFIILGRRKRSLLTRTNIAEKITYRYLQNKHLVHLYSFIHIIWNRGVMSFCLFKISCFAFQIWPSSSPAPSPPRNPSDLLPARTWGRLDEGRGPKDPIWTHVSILI